MTNKNNFFQEIEKSIHFNTIDRDILNDFLDTRNKIQRYAVGRNDEARSLCENFKIDGIIDDYYDYGSEWNNLPVVRSDEILNKSIVVNCVSSISPISVSKNLSMNHNIQIIEYCDLVKSTENSLSLPWFCTEIISDFKKNIFKLYQIFMLIDEEKSKNIFKNILKFRLSGNFSFMNSYSVRLNDQYFEDFMEFKNEIFVDAGGFDGDTTEEFCRRYPDYKKILFFEPSKINLKKAKIRNKNLKNIKYFNLGLSDKKEVLLFNSSEGSASSINNSGSEKINVDTLDSIVNHNVTFIKMDLEGWELKALKGCEDHIRNDNPKLAIAIYHKISDFYEIPNYILSINPNYSIYIRHYTEGWSESIMFFVPKKQ